jgi:hypothetical protein
VTVQCDGTPASPHSAFNRAHIAKVERRMLNGIVVVTEKEQTKAC